MSQENENSVKKVRPPKDNLGRAYRYLPETPEEFNNSRQKVINDIPEGFNLLTGKRDSDFKGKPLPPSYMVFLFEPAGDISTRAYDSLEEALIDLYKIMYDESDWQPYCLESRHNTQFKVYHEELLLLLSLFSIKSHQ